MCDDDKGSQSFSLVKSSCFAFYLLLNIILNFDKDISDHNQQESSESVSEYLVSPIVIENNNSVDQDVGSPGPSRAKSPRVESSVLKSLKTSLKDEITSELRSLLADSQKEILKLLKAKTNTNVREEPDEDTENETRSFYTPTKSVRINSTQNNDPCSSRNYRRF